MIARAPMAVCRLLSLFAAILGAAIGSARAGDVQEFSYASAVLGRTFEYSLYRPSSARAGEKFPVLYLLHGAGGDHRSWIGSGKVQVIADRLIAAGEIRPIIIVMPGAGQCWWVDAPSCQMETAFWQELAPRIAARGDAATGRGSHAIAGVSAGGFGAIRLALAKPDRFAVAAALSPAIYTNEPPEFSQARTAPSFRNAAGEFDAEAWRRNSWMTQLPGYAAARMPLAIRIATGDHDEYGLAMESALLHGRLRTMATTALELRINDGTHSWRFWSGEVEAMLRFIDRHLDRPGLADSRVSAVQTNSAAMPNNVYGRR